MEPLNHKFCTVVLSGSCVVCIESYLLFSLQSKNCIYISQMFNVNTHHHVLLSAQCSKHGVVEE